MQEESNKMMAAYRQGMYNEREISKDKARNVIKNIINADDYGLIQNAADVIEFIRVEFDIVDERG